MEERQRLEAEFRKDKFLQGKKGKREKSERKTSGTWSQVSEPIPGP